MVPQSRTKRVTTGSACRPPMALDSTWAHRVAPAREVMPVIEKVKTQKGVIIEHQMVEGANHFFDGKVEELTQTVDTYLDKRLGKREEAA